LILIIEIKPLALHLIWCLSQIRSAHNVMQSAQDGAAEYAANGLEGFACPAACCFGTDTVGQYRQVASYIDRILKDFWSPCTYAVPARHQRYSGWGRPFATKENKPPCADSAAGVWGSNRGSDLPAGIC
jgi:hypothetical protein